MLLALKQSSLIGVPNKTQNWGIHLFLSSSSSRFLSTSAFSFLFRSISSIRLFFSCASFTAADEWRRNDSSNSFSAFPSSSPEQKNENDVEWSQQDHEPLVHWGLRSAAAHSLSRLRGGTSFKGPSLVLLHNLPTYDRIPRETCHLVFLDAAAKKIHPRQKISTKKSTPRG